MLTAIFAFEMIVCGVLYYDRVRRTKELIHPDVIFLLLYSFVTSGHYFARFSTNSFGGRFFVLEAVPKASLISLAGFIMYVLTYFVRIKTLKSAVTYWVVDDNRQFLTRYWRIAMLACVGLLLVQTVYFAYAGVFTTQRGQDQFNKSAAMSLVMNTRGFLCLGILICTHLSLLIYGRMSPSVLLVTAMVFVLDFVLGRRGTSFLTIFGILYLHSKFRKLSVKFLVLAVLAGLVVNYAITLTRLMGTPSEILSSLARVSFTSARDIAYRFLMTLAATEIDTLFVSLYSGTSGALSYGATYLGSALNLFFPYSLFGFYIMEPINVAFRNRFYADLTSMGYDFTLVSESIMNFGWLGPAIIMPIVALFMCALVNYSHQKDVFLPLKTLTCLTMFFALRTDSNGTLKSIVYSGIFFWLILLAARKTRLRKVASPS